MNEIIKKENIENLIYEIRGKQVMLDSDLARLYETSTGNLNRAIKRNIKRFPHDFYFQLKNTEYKSLLCQNGIANKKGGRTILPYVFTEQGISMLASVLKTDIAAEVSVNIMRAFVAMKKYISTSLIEQKYINNLVLENHENIKQLQESFEFEPVEADYFGEVAKKYKYKDSNVVVGFITSVSESFCSSCTRARLSANGHLYTCLFNGNGHNIRDFMRQGATDTELLEYIRTIWRNRQDRYSDERKEEATTSRTKVEMSYIGG